MAAELQGLRAEDIEEIHERRRATIAAYAERFPDWTVRRTEFFWTAVRGPKGARERVVRRTASDLGAELAHRAAGGAPRASRSR